MTLHRGNPGGALFLLNSLQIGGSERKTVRLANALSRAGHALHLAWLNGPEDLRGDIDPRVAQVPLSRTGKYDPKVARDLARYIDTKGIVRLLAVNLYPLLYCVPGRWFARVRPVLWAGVNTTDIQAPKEARQMLVYGPLLRRVEGIVFGCCHQMDRWAGRYRLPRDRSRVVYNGVDVERFSPARDGAAAREWRWARGIDDADVLVGTIGQMRPEKQQVDLIAAVARLRDQGYRVVAAIVGEGPEGERLKKAAADLGVSDHLVMTGQLADVRPALNAFDVFALTSVAVETFSNAALEAMACGRPVVLSDIGGAREMITEGENGLIYPCSDVDALAQCIARLIVDPAFCRRLGSGARETAIDRFSFDAMVAAYEKLLDLQNQESGRWGKPESDHE